MGTGVTGSRAIAAVLELAIIGNLNENKRSNRRKEKL